MLTSTTRSTMSCFFAAVDDFDVYHRTNDHPTCLLRKRTNLRVHMKPNTPPFPKKTRGLVFGTMIPSTTRSTTVLRFFSPSIHEGSNLLPLMTSTSILVSMIDLRVFFGNGPIYGFPRNPILLLFRKKTRSSVVDTRITSAIVAVSA